MDNAIFKKMKVKEGSSSQVFNAPEGFPEDSSLAWVKEGVTEYVHLFVESKSQFDDDFAQAAAAVAENGLFWISYPKGKGKSKPDINRDSLWDLVIPQGWHPVSQVSLDDTWSAVRLRPNEAGVVYARPNAK